MCGMDKVGLIEGLAGPLEIPDIKPDRDHSCSCGLLFPMEYSVQFTKTDRPSQFSKL